MSRFPRAGSAPPAVAARLSAVAAGLGAQAREARLRRRWTTERLAAEAGVSRTLVYLVERGERTTIETYARLGAALGLRLEASLDDPRRHARPPRAEDPVHAAIVELLAARYAAQGRLVTADEPFQHYHFAGRADLAVIDPAGPDLLHHEVKTAIPNVGELAGAWNVKRQYLALASAGRHAGPNGFRSVTHVLTVAWTAECLRVLRLREASIRSLGPDDPAAFAAWWQGGVPATSGVTATAVLLDPIERPRAAPWVGLDALSVARPRHAGYAELLGALRMGGRA
jgi:transcriptional regulator with XRE-family HTH domain